MILPTNFFSERDGDFMGLLAIDYDPNAIFHTKFKLVSGIPGWPENLNVIKAELLEDRIKFYQYEYQGGKSTSLMYNQITGTELFKETKTITKSTDTLGRALVGGALFGSTGAIVGSISAANDKTKEEINYYYRISYINSKGEPSEILFNRDCAPNRAYKFDRLLRERIPKKEKVETPEFL